MVYKEDPKHRKARYETTKEFISFQSKWKKTHPEYTRNDTPALQKYFYENKDQIYKSEELLKEQLIKENKEFLSYETSWKKKHPEYTIDGRGALKKYFLENKDQIYKDKQLLKEQNKILSKEKAAQKRKEHHKIHGEENRQKWRDWYQKNKDSWNVIRKRKKITNPRMALKYTVMSRIGSLLRKQSVIRTLSYEELIGCSFSELETYIESKFTDKMNWDNRGGKLGWSIDHIIPCASFNLHDIEQQKKCFSYKNLQPLFRRENSSKSATYIITLPKPNNELVIAMHQIEQLKEKINVLTKTIISLKNGDV
jgi:hypothetical protein